MSSIADRYRLLAERFDQVVSAVPADRWANPSPCEEWTALDVVRHVADTERDLVIQLGLGQPEPGDDPCASWRSVRVVVQDLLDDPATAGHAYDGYFGPTTFERTIDTFYCLDLLVHAWDLARAAGLAELEPMPSDEITASWEAMSPLSGSLRQPGLCGPEVPVADGADQQTRFLAFLGRRA